MSVSIEVGKRYPGGVPPAEGAHLEMKADGLMLLIQMPGCTRDEARAFRKGVTRHTYIEFPGTAPVAVWAFDFKPPHGGIDVNFNAKPVPAEWIKEWMVLENGQVKNAMRIILLDGDIVRGMKLFGLETDAVERFHQTIRKQLSSDYSQFDYDRALQAVYAYTIDDFFKMGTVYKSKS